MESGEGDGAGELSAVRSVDGGVHRASALQPVRQDRAGERQRSRVRRPARPVALPLAEGRIRVGAELLRLFLGDENQSQRGNRDRISWLPVE